MLVSGKIQYVKNLLAINKKALIGLHNIAGMDFEKEFVILERFGKFTHNSIIKELNNITHGTGGCLIDCNHIFVIYQDNSAYGNGRFLLAKLTNKSFDSQRATIEGFEQSCGWRWFDTIIGKSDFEAVRKSDGHYFIIAQSRDYSIVKENNVDFNERFRVAQDYGRIYATPLNKNCDNYYDNICDKGKRGSYYLVTTGYEFDKSGYIRGQNNYEQRLRKIRMERSESQAAKYDNTEKFREFEERVRSINEAIISKLSDSDITRIPYYQIHDICYNLNWILKDLKAFRENKFRNMNDIKWTLEQIEKYISKAENVLKSLARSSIGNVSENTLRKYIQNQG